MVSSLAYIQKEIGFDSLIDYLKNETSNSYIDIWVFGGFMKNEKKAEAIELRKSGLSVKQIEKVLNVSRSSVSRWVRDVKLTSSQKRKLASNVSLNAIKSSELSKKKCDARRKQHRYEGFDLATKDELFRLVVALYWGEGSKTKNDTVISNSDPGILNLFVRWAVRNGYAISISIHYHEENGLDYLAIKNWWLKQMPEVLDANFTKPSICKVNRASQNKNVGKLPYGTAVVRVLKGTKLFHMIMGGIDYLKQIV